MNVTIWLTAGAVAGWFSYSLLRISVGPGFALSVIIGAGGGLLGGALLAPLLGSGNVQPGDFNPLAIFSAAATGLACVIVSGMIQRRFGT